ncbi:hypothetical protein B0H13DRAFT_2269511 [Mycena leptocephala]|nr:hypothetical protein B0H13DRAFT_2269511 [Mycena leptocephala]
MSLNSLPVGVEIHGPPGYCPCDDLSFLPCPMAFLFKTSYRCRLKRTPFFRPALVLQTTDGLLSLLQCYWCLTQLIQHSLAEHGFTASIELTGRCAVRESRNASTAVRARDQLQRLGVARCCVIPESSQRLGLQTDLTLFTAEDHPRGLDHIVAVKHGANWAEHWDEHGTRFLILHAQAGKIPQRGGLERSNLRGAPIYPSSVSLAHHEVNVATTNKQVTSPPGVVLRLYLRVSCLKLVSTPILAGANAALSWIVAARLVPRHQWMALTSYMMEGRGWAGW